MRRLLFAVLLVGAVVTVPTTVAARDDEKLTFTVGQLQHIDSLNVTVGGLVIDYEIWNLIWPSLDRHGGRGLLAAAGHGRELDEQRRRSDVDLQDAP